MKTLQLAFSILILGLTGCAPSSYQRSYVGYSGGYDSRYVEQNYYEYPVQSYYQPVPVIYSEHRYLPSHYPHRHDGHSHRQSQHVSRHNDWEAPKRRHEDQQRHNTQSNADRPRNEPIQREQRRQARQEVFEPRNQNNSVARASRHENYSAPRSHGGGREGGQNRAEHNSAREYRKHESR